MEYDERLNLLSNEIYGLYSLIGNYQNNFFHKLDYLKELQNNIKQLSVNIKNENFIKKEIDKLQLLIYNFIIFRKKSMEYR